ATASRRTGRSRRPRGGPPPRPRAPARPGPASRSRSTPRPPLRPRAPGRPPAGRPALVAHGALLRGPPGQLGVFRRNESHRLAHVANDLPREHRLVGELQPVEARAPHPVPEQPRGDPRG